jgi:hypothetical protein
MKHILECAVALALVVAVSACAFGPVSHGPWPFPEDGSSGNPVAHGPWPFPEDGSSGNPIHA